MSRRKIREVLLQTIFQMDFHKENFEESALNYLNDQPLSDVDRSFSQGYIRSLTKATKTVDDEIIKNLKGWKLDRISKIDLAILRLATYEILFEEEVPKNVSINEAVELAKKYSDEESRKFINGVLDAIAHKSEN